MTPEERWTKIENAIHALTELAARHDSVLARHESVLAGHESLIEKQNVGIRDLITVSRTFLDSQKETGTQIQELRDAQKHTDEKLNALIDTVDRIIRRGNGI